MCQKVTRVGVIDQHSYWADHHRQVNKILPAEATSDLSLVAGAAEHHRHVDGRVEQERPGLQGKRRGHKEEQEEEEEEEGRPRGGRRMSPGRGHIGSLLPAKEGWEKRVREGEMMRERATVKHNLLYYYDIFDITGHNPSVHIVPLFLSPGLSLYDSINPAFSLLCHGGIHV